MVPLSWNEALSGITGTISLTAWIFLLLPQLAENYQQQSAEGISLTFLLIWFVGDVTNLAGAVWAGLVPTVIALAAYFCFADAVLIGQCLYYNALNRRKAASSTEEAAPKATTNEQTPLLNGHGRPSAPQPTRKPSFTDVTSSNLGLPGSRRRSSATSNPLSRRRTTSTASLPPIAEALTDSPSPRRAVLKNTLSVFGILAIGTLGWLIAYKTGAWQPTPVGHEADGEKGGDATPLGAEILGYVSAVAYLGARVPQIVKNWREKSCEGLSLLFFLLSLLGNLTYGAGILFHSVETQYFLTNLPWLLGSFGTIGEDICIFVQFRMYGERTQQEEAVVEEDGTREGHS